MAHQEGHTGPYGELFELQGQAQGETWEDINWENPSAQEMSMIQQDPKLQSIYLRKLLKAGGQNDPFEDGTDPGDLIYQWGTSSGFGDPTTRLPTFVDLSREELEKLASFGGATEPREDYLQYFLDYQEGLRRLQSGDVNIDALTRELGLLERGVTGPGGLTQQKGTMAEILQQKIGASRQAYVPKEKASRYGQVTGTGGGVDPTSSYLSGVGSDVSAYGTSITGIDKSIQDILTGTGAGSIHETYGTYGNLVGESLFDGDTPWYG